jgi:hypothetical protein
VLYGESKSAGSCGHFKFHTKRDATEKIDGIENAALAFIPEEYLLPLPRGATEAMIKSLAKRAGLQFDAPSLEELSSASGDVPYWTRKLCSYLHRSVPLEGRPRKIELEATHQLVERFVSEEGGSIARVALAHLFSVYPDLRSGAELCLAQKGASCSDRSAYALLRYGIIREDRRIAGRMMEFGLRLALSGSEGQDLSSIVAPAVKESESPVVGQKSKPTPIMTVSEHADDHHVAGTTQLNMSARRQRRRRQDRRASADCAPILSPKGRGFDCNYAARRT